MCFKELSKLEKMTIKMIIAFSVIIILFFVFDITDFFEKRGLHLQYDWPAILCAVVSVISAVSLGVAKLEQGKK